MVGLLLTLLGCGVFVRASFAEGAARQAWPQPLAVPAGSASVAAAQPQCEPDPVADAPPPPPTPAEVLRKGVLIVVSIPSQKRFVFKDGSEWGSTTVSTGRPGHGTPACTFSILQKHVRHRSTIYSGAPMPYMQRLTWGGIALHAGHVTGRPASHGCIRLPWDFARKLYTLTNPAATAVVVVKQPTDYAEQALDVVGAGALQGAPVRQAQMMPAPAPTPLAMVPVSGQPVRQPTGSVQTIQLAATPDPRGADWLWQQLSQTEPELQGLSPAIIPATVRAMQVYRLRASGQDAHAICSRLVARGVACMKVTT